MDSIFHEKVSKKKNFNTIWNASFVALLFRPPYVLPAVRCSTIASLFALRYLHWCLVVLLSGQLDANSIC